MRKLAPIGDPLFADPASVLQTRAWKQHFGEQNDYYEQVLRWVDPFHPSYGMEEPPAKYRKKGLIAYADGTAGGWNPGEGAGEYWYNGSAWKKIPRVGETATTPLDKSWIPAATVPVAPIWNKLVTGSAVTSVTTDGEVTLDGNEHGGYEFEGFWKSGAAARLRIYFNNDQTNTNYRVCGRYDGVGTGVIDTADCYVDTGGLGSNEHLSMRGSIIISPDGYIFFHAIVFRKETQYSSYFVVSKTSSVANLTRLDIVSSVASGIGINSRFRLWRRI